jgi:superfamily II DNA or RNA helicase
MSGIKKTSQNKQVLDKQNKQSKTKKPKPHQIRFADAFLHSRYRGAIAIHGIGSGKTLTSVITAIMYLKRRPHNFVKIATPVSLLEGYKNELYGYHPQALEDKRYQFYTYDELSNGIESGAIKNCKNSLLIIDEGHNLRTEVTFSDSSKSADVQTGIRSYNILQRCAMFADKVLILTATPIINEPYDIVNLVSAINGEEPPQRKINL